jgi:hypothetical protein
MNGGNIKPIKQTGFQKCCVENDLLAELEASRDTHKISDIYIPNPKYKDL